MSDVHCQAHQFLKLSVHESLQRQLLGLFPLGNFLEVALVLTLRHYVLFVDASQVVKIVVVLGHRHLARLALVLFGVHYLVLQVGCNKRRELLVLCIQIYRLFLLQFDCV